MKKTIAILSIFLAILLLIACAPEQPVVSKDPVAPSFTAVPNVVTEKKEDDKTDPSAAEDKKVSVLEAPIGTLPVFITSAGQSADIEMIKVMFMNNGMSYKDKAIATLADMEGCSTLVVAIGGSAKGLGAAGIDADEELARVEALLKEADEAGMTIVAMHVGGTNRRGRLGDRYIEPVLAYSDYCIVVEAGDNDGIFSNYCSAHNIPMDVAPALTEVAPILPFAFK